MFPGVPRKPIWIMASLAALVVGGAQLMGGASADVTGSGKHKEDRRKIGGFDKVEVGGALEVQIDVGGAGSEIVVSGDDNLVPLVQSEVKDGRLRLRSRENLRPQSGLTINVRVPSLREIEAAGAVRITARGLSGDNVKVEIAGASQVQLEGTVKKLDAELAGASRLTATSLQADSVAVEAAGASSAAVTARREVSGEAAGASHVQVHGSPASVNVETSGASSVSRKN
jgi:hypothetical protein